MAAEDNQVILDAPGPWASQGAGRATQISESQEIQSSKQSVQVSVLLADNVPVIKKHPFLKRKFFVSVSNDSDKTTAETAEVSVEGQMAKWNEVLDPFLVQPSSRLTFRLYAKRSRHSNILIGTHEMRIPLASQSDIHCVLGNGAGEAAQPTQPVTLHISVIIIPPNQYNSPPSTPIEDVGSPTEEATIPGRIQLPTPEHILPKSDHQPVETSNTMPRPQELSPTSAKNPRLVRDRVDEAQKLIGPIDRSDTWEGAVMKIEWVMETFGSIAELFPPAKMALSLLKAIPKALRLQYERDDNVVTLYRAMYDAFDFRYDEDTSFIESIKPQSKQAQILADMLVDVGSCCDFIQSYAKYPKFWERTLHYTIGGGPDKKIKELSDSLVKRRKDFVDRATISTQSTVFKILDGVANISTYNQFLSTHLQDISTQLQYLSTQLQDQSSQLSHNEFDAKIREIPYGSNSGFSSNKGCLKGTRVAFLEFIIKWVNNPDSERGLVLFGQAGTGKSSIAHEIARQFRETRRLTSSFIFSRSGQSDRKPYHLFTTLAHHLADRYPSFRIALGNIVKNDTALRIDTRDYDILFKSLILEPLNGLHIVDTILVVIDALDESGDTTGKTGLHKFLAENLIRLPSNFRVVITSRPEHAIVSALDKAQSVQIKHMDDTLLAKTNEDILTFFQQTLSSNEFRDYLEELVKKAEGLFQWAAVASQLILNPPAYFGFSGKRCINHFLDTSTNRRGQDPLDELYKEALGWYFKDKEERDLFCSVVGQLITSIEPLSIRSLTSLRQYPPYCEDGDAVVNEILSRLGSLLSNVNLSDKNLAIGPLHASFHDFLTKKDKSGDFYVDDRDAHDQLAHSCLNLLLDPRDGLKFNICQLETSYLANDDVEDLNSRVEQHIPPALSYACRFWDDHLKHTDLNTDLFRNVETLFKEKFLFWLEALSLTRNIGLAPSAFATLNKWLASSQGVSRSELKEFESLVDDAAVFVRHFGMAMAKSAPHIYLSALPFAPTCSPVSTHYSTSFPRILHVELGQLSRWPSSEMLISNFGSGVLSVAFSPDGQRIVSGSLNRTVQVWNATTGETAAGPFTGHTLGVNSVAFSPDGQHIASGSEDDTIRVWNATSGEMIAAGPFTGHENSVNSVAFSPDGQYIASGSDDHTVRVWNAMTGETVAGPFTGHENDVGSVAFSPDGQYVASGSVDRTIRVWNSMTGKTAAGPFTGLQSAVLSVAFSPDGRHIVLGLRDDTIRVWDAMTGETTAGPFIGHKGLISAVAFSPDGQHIVSGSLDSTIRMWNAMTGETAAGPFIGHEKWVTCVAFSPDGQLIVSGSWDNTIRMWNAMTGETSAEPVTEYSLVTSVAFSPDGQYIASGSEDRKICVWDAVTGEIAAGPFTGHTDRVTCLAFSPDGQYIASGSRDETIRVWVTMTGEIAASPFTGSPSSVYSIVFSSDGQRIVSDSYDRTICVWDAMTGETAAGPFTNDSIPFESVAFSPDGQHVADSGNRTIHVWNFMTGETVAGPFTGHEDYVTSVAFSSDGQRIVSGSRDRTIRVWDAMTGETTAGPFTGHKSPVNSVAFSPDGKHIISGALDRTIRVWNAMTGDTAAGPFPVHTDSVDFVAFSPDGQHIVSSSRDRTIRVSNITMGKTETTDDVDFTDRSAINNDGWICGSKGELLMWIPSEHRVCLHRPSTICISGKRGTRLDLSDFVHGDRWATCIDT